MRLHQLLAAAAPADAVTGQALAWRAALADAGVEGAIYAEHVHPELSGRVRRLDELSPGDGAPVVLRYSIWSAAVERAADVAAGRLGLVYHNITPAHLLARSSPALAELCERGRRALPGLAPAVSVAIADSGFNAAELRAAGFRDPVVVPLLLSLPARREPPRPSVPPVVLTVGRVAPSKRIEDVVRAAAVLRRHLMPEARLEVIGSWEGHERYRAALGRLAGDLGAAGAVRFRGRVSDAALARAYREAGVYLGMSEHEGFCAPLVEALAHGVPVVARGAGAVPETLGGAGLLLPGRDAALAAEALARVLTDPELRRTLAARAEDRLRELAPPAVARRVREAVAPLLG